MTDNQPNYRGWLPDPHSTHLPEARESVSLRRCPFSKQACPCCLPWFRHRGIFGRNTHSVQKCTSLAENHILCLTIIKMWLQNLPKFWTKTINAHIELQLSYIEDQLQIRIVNFCIIISRFCYRKMNILHQFRKTGTHQEVNSAKYSATMESRNTAGTDTSHF